MGWKAVVVEPHLSRDEVAAKARATKDADELRRWQAIALKLDGKSTAEIAAITGHKTDWVRRVVHRYNAGGPAAMTDRRGAHPGKPRILTEADLRALEEALSKSPADGGLWTSPKVALWIRERTGTEVTDRTGWAYLKRLDMSKKVPRPAHPRSDPEACEAFKKGASKLRYKGSVKPIRGR